MSTQTIIKNTSQSIINKIDDYYICEGDKLLNYLDYNIGDKIDFDKFTIIRKLDDYLNSLYCEDEKCIIQKINSILLK